MNRQQRVRSGAAQGLTCGVLVERQAQSIAKHRLVSRGVTFGQGDRRCIETEARVEILERRSGYIECFHGANVR